MENTLLEARNLSVTLIKKNTTIPIVQNVSFELSLGKTLAIVGESGSGKTTLAHSLLRLFPPSAHYVIDGVITYDQKNLVTLSQKKLESIRGSEIAMIFQDPAASLNPVFSIGRQVCEMFEVHHNAFFKEAEEKTIEILEKVGLPRAKNCFKTYPHEISGGMKQRVLIAMAVCLKPKILIADEPTAALDRTVQKGILELLRSLQKEYGLSLILITHDMDVMSEMADDVAVMYAGRIVEYATCKELLTSPAHPYTQALIAARPQKHLRKKMLPVISGIAPTPEARPSGCPFHPRCPFVMPHCKTGTVPTFQKDDSRQIADCWLYDTREFWRRK